MITFHAAAAESSASRPPKHISLSLSCWVYLCKTPCLSMNIERAPPLEWTLWGVDWAQRVVRVVVDVSFRQTDLCNRRPQGFFFDMLEYSVCVCVLCLVCLVWRKYRLQGATRYRHLYEESSGISCATPNL